MTLLDDLRSRRTEARAAADGIITRAAEEGRDLDADELTEYQSHLGEERELQDRLDDERDREVAEVRAAQVRSTETRPSMGEMLQRAVTEASGLGAATTPSEFATQAWDRLAAQAVFLQTGVRVVTTNRDSLVLPRITSDPTAAWTNEGSPITASDPGGDTVTAVPRKLAGLTQVSNETLADSSPSVYEIIAATLVRSIALKFDKGAFEGTGTAPEIRGLANVSGIQTSVGGAPDLDDVVQAIEFLQNENATPGALVMHPRAWTDYLRIKEATGSNKPVLQDSAGSASQAVRPMIFGIPVYVSSQLDPNLAYCFDPSQVVVVRREDVRVETDSSRLFNSDQSEVRAIMRVDVVVPNPKAVVVMTGVS
jgi:HK97 family phage major capsid protein